MCITRYANVAAKGSDFTDCSVVYESDSLVIDFVVPDDPCQSGTTCDRSRPPPEPLRTSRWSMHHYASKTVSWRPPCAVHVADKCDYFVAIANAFGVAAFTNLHCGIIADGSGGRRPQFVPARVAKTQ